jgi:hypothetical protein
MSAIFVGAKHVNALLSYVDKRDWRSRSTLTVQGKTLLQENVRSLTARYGKCGDEALNKAEDYTFECLSTAELNKIGPLDVLSMCDCFEYQAGETDDYEATEAAAIIGDIRKLAIAELLADKEAVWLYQG